MPRPLRIAHRGMPRLATENTLHSFALALDAGADGIELDVHATADGSIVVHHDPALASGAEIHSSTLAELLRASPALPTLESVCGLIGGRAELFVEIKGTAIEDQVEAALASYAGQTAIHSFDHELIHRLALGGTVHRLGILVEDPMDDPLQAMGRTGALDLWPHHSLVTRELVEAVHAFGGRVIPWTVNAHEDVQRVAALSVDGICTDDVRALGNA